MFGVVEDFVNRPHVLETFLLKCIRSQLRF